MSDLSSTEIFQMKSSVRFAGELSVSLRALADTCPRLGALAGKGDVKALWIEQGHALNALAGVIEETLRAGSSDMASDLGRDWLRGVLWTAGVIDGMLRMHRASVGISEVYSAAKAPVRTIDMLVDRLLTLQAAIASFNRVKAYAAARKAA